jgi:arabinofuranosyltransferase
MATPVADAVVVLLFLASVAVLFPFTADDSFIVMRYARNLVEHGELAFNLGEPVNALTSPLHGLVVAALALLVGVDRLELANKVLGGAVVLGSVSFAARRLFPRTGKRMLFAALCLLSPFVSLWSVGGLETPILTALIALILVVHVEIGDGRAERARLVVALYFLMGLALLCRPDSLVGLAPIAVDAAWRGRRWRSTRFGAALLALMVVTWYGFACLYYGDPFPTSAYIKLLVAPTPLLLNVHYTLEFVLFSGALPAALLIALTRLAGGPQAERWRMRYAWVSVPLLLLYSVSHSAQHMFFGFRCFAPYLPLLAALAVDAIAITRSSLTLALAALLALCQCLVVIHMRERGLNITWSGVFDDSHSFEYDDVSIAQYARFIQELKASAAPIRAHWAEHGSSERPRLELYTAGAPAFLLPEFYVLEQLVSYRHHCRPDLFTQAHYTQFLRIGPIDARIMKGFVRDTEQRGAGPAQLVYNAPLFFGSGAFAMEIFFVAEPRPLVLPSRIDGPCSTPAPLE